MFSSGTPLNINSLITSFSKLNSRFSFLKSAKKVKSMIYQLDNSNFKTSVLMLNQQ